MTNETNTQKLADADAGWVIIDANGTAWQAGRDEWEDEDDAGQLWWFSAGFDGPETKGTSAFTNGLYGDVTVIWKGSEE